MRTHEIEAELDKFTILWPQSSGAKFAQLQTRSSHFNRWDRILFEYSIAKKDIVEVDLESGLDRVDYGLSGYSQTLSLFGSVTRA